jgi:hypothetical protein
MADKKFPMLPGSFTLMLFLAAGLLFPAAFLGAQETTGNYFVRQGESGEISLMQRLSWPGDDNAARYEVVVIRVGEGVFAEIHRESTTQRQIEISLGPGAYRYQVRVFNLLNQFEYVTNWASFNIILALQPELTSYTPDTMYILDDDRWELQLTGKNLMPGGAVYLVPLEDPENPDEPGLPIAARQYSPVDGTGRAVFDGEDLRPGTYQVMVRNPGGLESALGPVQVSLFRRPWDIMVAAGYTPIVPLYGYFLEVFQMAPLGADIKGAFVFLKRRWGSLGVSADFQLHYLSAQTPYFDFSAYVAGGDLRVFYRKILPLRGLAFTAQLGAGINAAPWQMIVKYMVQTSEPFTSSRSLAVLGLSLEWRFARSFYAELGMDYVQLFSRETPAPAFLRPSLNIGWKY